MFTTANLIHSTRMAYQGIFLMGAFCAAMEVEPILQPKGRDVTFEGSGKGMKLDVKCVLSDNIVPYDVLTGLQQEPHLHLPRV